MLPLNTSEKLTQFLVGVQNSKELVKKLKSNKPFLIEFFKSAANDPTWMQSHAQAMTRLIKLIDSYSTQGMTLAEARELTQLAKTKLDPNSPLTQVDVNLEFETGPESENEETKGNKGMSHFLLGAASPTLAHLIEFSPDPEQKTIPIPMTQRAFQNVREFIETGTIQNVKFTKTELVELLLAADYFELPQLGMLICNHCKTEEEAWNLLEHALNRNMSDVAALLLKKVQGFYPGIILTCPDSSNFNMQISNSNVNLEALSEAIKKIRVSLPLHSFSIKLLDLPSADGNFFERLGRNFPWTTHIESSFPSFVPKISYVDLAKTVPFLPDLKSIRVVGRGPDRMQAGPCLQGLAKYCPKLEECNLHATAFSIADLQALGQNCKQLNKLDIFCSSIANTYETGDLSGFNLSEISLKEIRGLDQNAILMLVSTNLTKFTVEDTSTGEANAFFPLTALLGLTPEKCPNLTSLNYSGDKFTAGELTLLLQSHPQLTELRCAAYHQNALAAVASCEKLESLDIAVYTPVDPGMIELVIKGCPNLRRFNVPEDRRPGAYFHVPLELQVNHMPNTEELKISRQGQLLHGTDFPVINLSGLKELTALTASYLQDADLEPMIAGCSDLKKLNLEKSQIKNETVAVIARECPNIEELDLSHNPINKECVESLSKLSKIRVLTLAHTAALWKREIFEELYTKCPFLERIHFT